MDLSALRSPVRTLGFETYYVEQVNLEDCVYYACNPADFMLSGNARYFHNIIDRFDLIGHRSRAASFECNGPGYIGPSHAETEAIAPAVDLLIR
jgi:hypothetical protein